jgi:hypothetical protein
VYMHHIVRQGRTLRKPRYALEFERYNAQGKRRRKERSEWRAPTKAMKMPKAWPLLASA